MQTQTEVPPSPHLHRCFPPSSPSLLFAVDRLQQRQCCCSPHTFLKGTRERFTQMWRACVTFRCDHYCMYQQHRGCYGNRTVALPRSAVVDQTADSSATRPKQRQKNHSGKQGHLAEGCSRLLTAPAITQHLVYRTPTEGGRVQGSRG